MLKVGLLGLGRGGQRVAEVLLDSSWCRLIAVASTRPDRLAAFRRIHPEIQGYDDFRSLIVANPLDALFVAAPPYLRPKYIMLAAERNIPVWTLPPPGRRFEEAVQLIATAERSRCPIVVARLFGVEAGLQREALRLDQVGRCMLARATVMLDELDRLDWRGDSQRAVGGVLLDRAYPLVDMIVQVMGMPSSVYARTGLFPRSGRLPAADTEDLAALVCHFTGGGMAVLTACRAAGPPDESVQFHAVDGTIEVRPAEVIVRDRRGENELVRHLRPANPLRAPIEEFLGTVAATPRRFRSLMRHHLPSLAVIEAAYLSARTGQPESPATVFEIHAVPM